MAGRPIRLYDAGLNSGALAVPKPPMRAGSRWLGSLAGIVLVVSLCGAGGQAAEDEGALAGLTQREAAREVEAAGESIRLRELLTDLTRQTGVRLRAEPRLADAWVAVRSEGSPLGELMSRLASLVATRPGTARWVRVRGKSGDYRELREDPSSRESRRALTTARNNSFRTRYREAMGIAGTPPGRRDFDRGTNFRVAASAEGYSFLYRLAALAGERVPSGLMLQRTLSIPYEQLSEPMRAVFGKALVGSSYSSGKEHPDGRYEKRVSFDERKDMALTRLEFALYGLPERPGVSAFIVISRSVRLGCPNLLNPPIAPPEDQPEWLKRRLAREKDDLRSRRSGRRPEEPAEPRLSRRVTIPERTVLQTGNGAPSARLTTPSEALAILSQRTGIPLVAHSDPGLLDYYGWQTNFRKLDRPLRDVKGAEALDTLCEAHLLTWQMVDGWLEIRSPRFPFALTREVDLTPVDRRTVHLPPLEPVDLREP